MISAHKTKKIFTTSTLLVAMTMAMITLVTASCASLQAQSDHRQSIKFIQGTALPYRVLDNSLVNAAYPAQKLEIRNGGFGSDAAAHPINSNQFYALTDRGPNGKYKGNVGKGKQFVTPDYTPRIGLFELQNNGQIKMIREILLKDRSGSPISGLPNPEALGGTNEIAYDASGKLMTVHENRPFDKVNNPTKTDLYGLDAEGLAVMKDGSFWISDEYGPHIVHYDSSGQELHRINAFAPDDRNNVIINGKRVLLPIEFANRRANRGMEGLAISPDQSTLVGIMQSAMDNPDKGARKTDLTRIVTVNLTTGQVSQYLYRQQKAQNSNSGIVALNNHEFYVIERDGKFALKDNTAQKHVYKVNIADATNLERIEAHGDIKQDKRLGLTIAGQTLEQFIATNPMGWQALSRLGIKPASKRLVLDAVKQLNYPHDKLEGLWLRADGSLGLLNDDDFAAWSTDNKLEQKYLDKDKKLEDTNRLYIVTPSTVASATTTASQ